MMVSIIRCWDSNLQPSVLESPPITIRPWLSADGRLKSLIRIKIRQEPKFYLTLTLLDRFSNTMSQSISLMDFKPKLSLHLYLENAQLASN